MRDTPTLIKHKLEEGLTLLFGIYGLKKNIFGMTYKECKDRFFSLAIKNVSSDPNKMRLVELMTDKLYREIIDILENEIEIKPLKSK